MEEGFRTRATAVRTLLSDPASAYVVVTSPRPDAVQEATYFAGRLAERQITPAALVVNRVHPRFAGPGDAMPEAPHGSDLGTLVANLADLQAVATREAAAYGALADRVAPAPVGLVPLFGTDVHDLGGLDRVARYLFGPDTASTGADGVG